MNFKASFVSYLNQKYPQISLNLLNNLISEQLISPFQVTLSTAQIQKIKIDIKAYWQLRNWGESQLVSKYNDMALKKPNNYAVCMSYDFHINSEGQPELIEINTNSSFLALGLELYSFLKLPNVASAQFNENALVQMFRDEIKLIGGTENSVAIIDEKPEQQRLYVEFLIYQALLQKNNFSCEILDSSNTQSMKNFSLIYNRYTDFYLQNLESVELRKLFNEKLNFSPNPYEYFLLADKQRFLDWTSQTEIVKPNSLLKTYDLGQEDKEKIWSERKNLFIKPKNSYGSKQAYKAASISRRLFDEIYGDSFIAQQLSTPAEISVQIDSQPQKLKYDLRCYTYKSELQLIVARLYQGQTTNLKTVGGGFAAVLESSST